ncbi:class I adenylate-forming enzyme family protein [Streptomyces iconiensis]|uniref:Class I adenylate-forming enzyme family protein n=1 Tax=Streptomyces iconiensis TaxID=1384038 RepID=A0ABT6ZNC5_9ACTN|nr:class I adenylate-forming enzyme family protein [Streptomyces iconiensis]MDJ1130551.1 class I adenylate-forming enzyme family protein [Streptomyces iconiensis]
MTHIFGTHRSAVQRMRLYLDPRLGAGNFFWHTWAVATDPDRPIIFHRGAEGPDGAEGELSELSLNDMRVRVIRYAHWYRTQGIGPRSHVGVHTRDGLENLLHYIAVTSLGAVPVHANAQMRLDVAADYFTRTRVSVLVGDRDLIDACAAVWKEAPSGQRQAETVTVQDIAVLRETAPKPPRPMADFPYRHAAGDLVLISHSSGTTGRPKAPMFLHRSFFAGRWERLWAFPSLRSDRVLSALPASHSAGLAHLSMTITLGLPTLILDDISGAAVVRAINTFLPTMVLGFPIALAGLPTSDISPEAARTLHTWSGMGDASHEHHIRDLVAVGAHSTPEGPAGGSAYRDGLGSSEMGMVLFTQVHTPQAPVEGRLVGLPTSVVKRAAVFGDDGRELPPGQPGRLGVRAPSVTPGYWDDPGLTERSLLDGHFLTGDIVRRDTQGLWYHLDREPDVIHSADGPVYSLPLEEVVLLETGATDCAVFAADDPGSPRASCPVAVVLTDDGSTAGPDDLLERCNAGLLRKGLPALRALVVATGREGLPVGPTGKALKRSLRERHQHLLTDGATEGIAEGAVARAEPTVAPTRNGSTR